jgi:ABC-type phosphate/phosphonate transport system substrate-binding protein
MDPNLVEKVRAAFLKLDVTKPEHRAVIESLDPSYDGFLVATDQEYDVVRDMIKPFEK